MADFGIKVHWRESIIEVTYPDAVDAQEFDRYERKIREAIERMRGSPWSCLVNQTAMAVLPPEFTDRLTVLNAWAKERGMQRAARVIQKSHIAEWQAKTVLKKSGVDASGGVFGTRDEAWAALTKK